MNRQLRNELIALSHNEELSPELRETIRREIDGEAEFVKIERME